MSEKLLFDKLYHAKILQEAGVDHANAHAEALAIALSQNLYPKYEVDKMIDTARQDFRESIRAITEEFGERTNEIVAKLSEYRLEMKEIESRLEKAIDRNLHNTVSILGSLIVIVGVIATFAHAFF